jgi:acyl dehydratase
MPLDYSSLSHGDMVSEHSFDMDEALVSKYVEAVGDRTTPPAADGTPRVPPMAIAAISLRSVIHELGIPGGTLHAGQELAHARPVVVGERLTCRATVSQNSTRGGWRFMVVQMDVSDSSGEAVMTGKSTIMLPLDS